MTATVLDTVLGNGLDTVLDNARSMPLLLRPEAGRVDAARVPWNAG